MTTGCVALFNTCGFVLTSEAGPLSAPGQENVTNS